MWAVTLVGAKLAEKTTAEIRAWAAVSNIARFQRALDSETEEARLKILMVLLSIEYEKFEKETLPEPSGFLCSRASHGR